VLSTRKTPSDRWGSPWAQQWTGGCFAAEESLSLTFIPSKLKTLNLASVVLIVGLHDLALLRSSFSALATRQPLVLENIALRQQVAVLQRDSKRPRLMNADRVFWVLLSTIWPGWAATLTLVKPTTVIG
jgi:hypothetical protein